MSDHIRPPEWAEEDALGLTESRKNITKWRWCNEIFKIIVLNHIGPANLDELHSFPAHLSVMKCQIDSGSHTAIVTTGIGKQGFSKWLSYLESKNWIVKNGGGDVWKLTPKSNDLIEHIGDGEHKYKDGICEVCYWLGPDGPYGMSGDFDEVIDRLQTLAKKPKDDPVTEKYNEYHRKKGDVDAGDILSYILESDQPALTSYEIKDELINESDWASEAPIGIIKEIVSENTKQLAESDVLASYDMYVNGYGLADMDIKIRDGEVVDINQPDDGVYTNIRNAMKRFPVGVDNND